MEIFYKTENLERILRDGLRLSNEKTNEIRKPMYCLETTPRHSTINNRNFLSFSTEKPNNSYWISIVVNENDSTIKVGNKLLIEDNSEIRGLYENSLMSFSDYLEKIKEQEKSNGVFENPFTAEMLNLKDKEEFEDTWKEEFLNNGISNLYGYLPEVLVPITSIEPTEFNRTSKD